MYPYNQNQQKGFSIVEVIVAMGIFLTVMSTLPTIFVTQTKFNTLSQRKSEGLVATQAVLDSLRFEKLIDLPTTGNATENIDINGYTYLVDVHYCLNSSYCNAQTSRHITAKTYYREDLIYEVETVFTSFE